MTVGEKIRSIRKEHGYTQKQLAEKIGFPPQRIGQYETGVRNPRIETLLKIAHALEVPITALLDSDDEKILKTLAAGAKQVETINTEINRTLVEIQNLKAAGELEKAKEREQYLGTLNLYKNTITSRIDYTLLSKELDDESRENTLKQIADILEDINIGDLDDLIRLIEDFAYYNRSYTIENAEEKIKAAFEKLNIIGINELAKRAEEYTEIPKYQREVHVRPEKTVPKDQQEQSVSSSKEVSEQSAALVSLDDI